MRSPATNTRNRASLVLSNARLVRFESGDHGLLGWASFELYGHVRLDGVAVRRTRDGRLTLAFPERRDATGRRHPVVRPLNDEARREIEQQVFAALGLDAEAAP